MNKIVKITTMAVMAYAALGSAHAQTYMKAAEASAGIADGRVWNMLASDGKKGKLTFTRDGKGKISEPISKSIAWTANGNTFCMKMGFMLGTKCFQVVKIANGFQGYTNGKPSIKFTR
jgi:hypothetical protein